MFKTPSCRLILCEYRDLARLQPRSKFWQLLDLATLEKSKFDIWFYSLKKVIFRHQYVNIEKLPRNSIASFCILLKNFTVSMSNECSKMFGFKIK